MRFAPLLLLLLSCASHRDEEYRPFHGAIRHHLNYFLVYGDSREKLALEVWRKNADRERRMVIQRLTDEFPAFILNTGDLVKKGSSVANWETFDREHDRIRELRIPYFAGLGNHEYWTPNTALAMNNFFKRFPHLQGRKWYDLRYRGVVVLVLDSNIRHLEDYEVAAQFHWFDQQLARAERDSDVRCVIVCTHHPPYTNAVSHGGSVWVEKNFAAKAKKHAKVKAFISGHSHTYERFLKDGVHFVVSGGGGAPLMSLKEDKKHKDEYDGPRRFHYCRITAKQESVYAEVVMLGIDNKWSVVDRFKLAN